MVSRSIRGSISRSGFLRLVGLAGASALLAACGQAPAASPTAAGGAAPAQPTASGGQAAAPPTATTAQQAAPAATAAPAGQVVGIKVAHAWEAAFLPIQEAFDKQFMEKHPNIKVTIINNTWSQHNQVVPTWASSHTLPDLI